MVRFNGPVEVNSPGLLKRKRKRSEDGEEGKAEAGGLVRASKRIRWCELDSTGGNIDPQFSEEEEVEEVEEEEEADSVKQDFSFVGAMLSDIVDRIVETGTKTEATKDLESSRVTELQKQSPSSCFLTHQMIRS